MIATLFDDKCGTCGEPATNISADVKEVEPADNYKRYTIVEGSRRGGCDQHPTKSRTFDRAGNELDEPGGVQ